ncbi:MAG: hypothetical protein ACON35_02275 [Candidatus Marinamargulisbacteria bacterium]
MTYGNLSEKTATAMLEDEKLMYAIKIRPGRNDGGVFDPKKLDTAALHLSYPKRP